ncbi:hypothetical protein OSG_eHP18_00100 [environmental Halophage eHP-18]|nr:hypothetical protein OSG_eHP17_00010 [environmental Halophage eHP-17]AFH22177.1 hypothetical protein OSG_eHP18_00100 [environmental Halophage eHP-18]AFH22705.1 hypothetical protein OSG_eHP33_00010 [environmental Halophage eHP-33]
MPQLTITHADGSTETIPQTVGYERTKEVGKMRRARITVERSLAQQVTLEPKSDTIDLGSIDTLRLVDIENGAETYTLVCYSFEWDANRTAPTVGGDLRQGDDQTLITNLIGEVSNWSKGTVTSLSRPLEFVFNHAARHEALRRIERNVPGEILFRDSGTVDYTSRLGSDKSGSVELSASAGTIEDEITITNRGRELDGTHFRVLGAHEGEAQLSANLVPASDSASYDNRVNYTSPRWSDGDPRDWDRYENKDVTDQDTLFEEAENLGDEIKEELIEAEATVPDGVNIDVGDTVRVVKPDAGLDRDMRIHRLKEVVEGTVRKLKVLLSTRTTARKDGSDDLRDIQRFNTGFQGSSVAVNGGPVIGAVDSGNPLTFGFRYPDLEFENTATLRVRGESYRIDSKGAASGGGSTETSNNGGTFNDITKLASTRSNKFTSFTSTSSQTATVTEPIGSGGEQQNYRAILEADATSTNLFVERVVLEDTTEGDIVYTNDNIDQSRILLQIPIDETIDRNGNDIEARVTLQQSPSDFWDVTLKTLNEQSHSHLFDWQHNHDVTIPNHTHPPDAGIFTTGDTPSNTGVDINGTTVASGIGTGTFETTVDIAGDLTKGSWNDITLTSDSLGRVQATVFIEGYDQIGTR